MGRANQTGSHSGGSRGGARGARPLIFRPTPARMSDSLCLRSFSLDQPEGQRAKKNVFGEDPPPPLRAYPALLHTLIACVQTPPSPKKKSVGRETLSPIFLRGRGRLYTG